MSPPVWTDRNKWLQQFIPNNKSIIDWGCGDKDVLRYITPSIYLGIDQNPLADIQADFNKSIPTITEKYDLGLVLGVLEYLQDPEYFLRAIKPTAEQFFVLCLTNRKKKSEWTNAFTDKTMKTLLRSVWTNVSFERNKNYLLGFCTD